MHDVGVVSLFPHDPPAFPAGASSSAGIEPGAAVNTLVAPFNDLEVVRASCNVMATKLPALSSSRSNAVCRRSLASWQG